MRDSDTPANAGSIKSFPNKLFSDSRVWRGGKREQKG